MKQLLVLLLLAAVPLMAVSGPTVKSSKSNSSDRGEAPTTDATSTLSGIDAGGPAARPADASKPNGDRNKAAPFGANSPQAEALHGKPTKDQRTGSTPAEPAAIPGKPSKDQKTAGKPTKDQRTGSTPAEPAAIPGKPSKDQKTGYISN